VDSGSYGGLYTPSQSLNVEIKKWEKIFQDFHGATLSNKHDPINKVVNLLLDHSPGVPKKVCQLFSTTRFFYMPQIS